MNKWAVTLGLLIFTVLYIESVFCQNQILGKIKVTGPEEVTSVIGEPKQVLLRVKSKIRDLEFESSMSKELPIHKQGESLYNVYVPPGRQLVTIMAKGFQNIDITYVFKENRSYLIELDPEQIPIPIQSKTDTEAETNPTVSPPILMEDNKWAIHRNIAFGGAVVFGITAAFLRASANKSYSSYQSATSAEDGQKFRDETEKKDLFTYIAGGLSGAFLTYAIYSWFNQGSSSANEQSLSVGFTGNMLDVRIKF